MITDKNVTVKKYDLHIIDRFNLDLKLTAIYDQIIYNSYTVIWSVLKIYLSIKKAWINIDESNYEVLSFAFCHGGSQN